MKGKVVIGLALALASSPAYADGIQSPKGISQSDWNASSAYKNFQCPAGTGRGEGVDMNFTTDKSDDFYFVECNSISPVYLPKVIVPAPILTPATPVSTTPVQSETSTATTVSSVSPTIFVFDANTETVIASSTHTDTKTEIETTTATVPVKVKSILDEELNLNWSWSKILDWIMAWFDSFWNKL